MIGRALMVGLLVCSTLSAGVYEDNDIDLIFMNEESGSAKRIESKDVTGINSTSEPISTERKETPTGYYENSYNSYGAENNYFIEAGRYYNVDPRLLWCVAKVESNLNPNAVNKNTNGTYDIGMMQVNTVHLPTLAKFGITKQALFDTRTNIFVGGWVMAGCLKKHGMTRNGITCYNGRLKNNPYADKILKVFYQQEAKYAIR